MAALWRCATGPRLFRIPANSEGKQSRPYEANTAEVLGDRIIQWASFMWSLSCWTSPILVTYLYRKGYFTLEGMNSGLRMAMATAVIMSGAFWLRGIGRWANPDYCTFIAILTAARQVFSAENKVRLARYDFDFWAWPVNYSWTQMAIRDVPMKRLQPRSKARGVAAKVWGLPCDVASYLMVHTFGRRMIYPGTVGLLQKAMAPMLQEGRKKLVEKYDGERAKLLAQDGNEIDTMFVDRRSMGEEKGRKLVITSEGNAGFYEVGCMCTPLDAGYSVLGWNHPGFGGSTGIPMPENEGNAIDVVMQYAIHQLGFSPENIVIFAWSIGGYPASFAAMNHPTTSGVILDATFDDLLPLAISRMPESLRGMVIRSVNTYFNLDIAAQLNRYPGPVMLVRRTRDEMITTTDPDAIESNRGNDLLVKLLQFRYPKLITESTITMLREWLSARTPTVQAVVYNQYSVDEQLCTSLLKSWVEENSANFPCLIGDQLSSEEKTQLVLFLATKHMINYESTHCTPLPASHFRLPWSLAALRG
ncbi:ABHD16A [Branchiostoma lanceolatum]|nr:ABHD16A [Branchiostoma lanceolatum]